MNSGLLVGAYSLTDNHVFGSNSNNKKIKVGLVGCGKRGTGAAFQALEADPSVEIVGLADVFSERLENVRDILTKKYGQRINLPDKRLFLGFEGYKKLMKTDVDVVLLAAPPNFRPDHLEEAVKRGKHIFCEKPVAVDIPGIHRIRESIRLAKEKELCLVSGFCFRYANANREFVQQIKQGSIGDIKQISTFRMGGELTFFDPKPEWSPLESQLRSWYFYQRYSGDLINEQSIHSIDYTLWLVNDKLPVKVSGIGGRQNRPENMGNTFDHFALEFDFGDDLKAFHFARQQTGTEPRNSLDIIGTKGSGSATMLQSYDIKGQNSWKFSGEYDNMYQIQHNELFAAIRNKQWVFDGDTMTDSTLLAIWGREATYAGRVMSYEEIMNSQKVLGPNSDSYSWEMDVDKAAVPKPGHYTFT